MNHLYLAVQMSMFLNQYYFSTLLLINLLCQDVIYSVNSILLSLLNAQECSIYVYVDCVNVQYNTFKYVAVWAP